MANNPFDPPLVQLKRSIERGRINTNQGYGSTRTHTTPSRPPEGFNEVGDVSSLTLPTGWGIYVYGNSFGVLDPYFSTDGLSAWRILEDRLVASHLTGYAVFGERTPHLLYSMVEGVGTGAVSAIVPGAKMPEDNSRQGLIVLETLGNDIGHYPDMSDPVVAPITNQDYLDGMRDQYRAAIALASGCTRVEVETAGTYSGTGWTVDFPFNYLSGGAFSFTSTNGDSVDVDVTPPQEGPLVGKVFLLVENYSPSNGANGTFDIDVDTVFQVSPPVPSWERYMGIGGATHVDPVVRAVTIELPVDGDPHTITLTHTGGNFLSVDAILVPGSSPNPVVMTGHELNPVEHASGFSASEVADWAFNSLLVHTVAESVVDEFDNCVFVPSTCTQNGLYSADGIHLNDRGQEQRANDIMHAMESFAPRFENRTLEFKPDGDFETI